MIECIESLKLVKHKKPDWKTAPRWAKYLAMDRDGTWTWFEKEPEIAAITNEWIETSIDGRVAAAADSPFRDWEDSLEERPS